MARTCKNCYSLVNDEHKFCTQCGEKVPFPKHDETKKENEVISYPNDNSNKVVIISLLVISFFIYIIFSIFTDSHRTNNDISIDKVQKELIKIETPDLSSPEEKENLLKEAKKDYDSRNFNSAIFEYKEWKYESFDNLFRIITNGKVGATGHEFGLIRKKVNVIIIYYG